MCSVSMPATSVYAYAVAFGVDSRIFGTECMSIVLFLVTDTHNKVVISSAVSVKS